MKFNGLSKFGLDSFKAYGFYESVLNPSASDSATTVEMTSSRPQTARRGRRSASSFRSCHSPTLRSSIPVIDISSDGDDTEGIGETEAEHWGSDDPYL